MSVDNTQLVRDWFEQVWNKGRVEAIAQMMAPDCIVHGFGQDTRGPEEFKPIHALYRGAFPDVRLELHEVFGEGDLVAARWTGTGTHQGDTLGFVATHKRTDLSGMTIVRIRNGKIVEGWNNFDQYGMLQQLGAVGS